VRYALTELLLRESDEREHIGAEVAKPAWDALRGARGPSMFRRLRGGESLRTIIDQSA
jgi:hypothetical protein